MRVSEAVERGGGALPPGRLLVDLAAERLGARVVHANDEFFAPAAALLRADPPVWREGEYTDRGKWMDGWETRRRRDPGHDECIIRLGAPGRVSEVVVDTSHFRGNHPEACALDGLDADADGPAPPASDAVWRPLVERTPLGPDAVHRLAVGPSPRVTHVRLRIFPDGGVARLRVLGRVDPAPIAADAETPPDLAALVAGGLPVGASDATFGEPRNLLLPGESTHMGEGWETRRRRGPGHDWVILALGRRGRIERVELSTRHFKGNYPAAASLDALDVGSGCDAPGPPVPVPDGATWTPLLPRTALRPDAMHAFTAEVAGSGPWTHVRLNVFPDGGVARLRVHGWPDGAR